MPGEAHPRWSFPKDRSLFFPSRREAASAPQPARHEVDALNSSTSRPAEIWFRALRTRDAYGREVEAARTGERNRLSINGRLKATHNTTGTTLGKIRTPS